MARFTSIGMPRKTFVASAAEETNQSASNAAGQADANGNAAAGSSTDDAPKKKTHRSGKRLKAKLQRQAAVAAGEIPAPVPTAPKVREEGEDGGKGKKFDKKRKADRAGGDEGGEARSGGWGRDASIAKKTRFWEDRAEQRRLQRIDEKKAALTCFACRGSGHSARECPNGESGNICYRCGSTEHSLKDCRKPVSSSNPTPFASCYVCQSKGHLSSQCPDNAKGVYVKGNGGKCKICSSVRHLVADCPELAARRAAQEAEATRESDEKRAAAVQDQRTQLGADEDDWMAESRVRIANGEVGQQGKKKKIEAGKAMEKKPFNNNGLRRPYKEGELVGRETEGFAEGVEGKPVKPKKAKVVAF